MTVFLRWLRREPSLSSVRGLLLEPRVALLMAASGVLLHASDLPH